MLWTFVRVLVIWVIGTLIALSPAFAQDSRNMTVDGERGRWFPLKTAGLLLEDHLKVPELQKLVEEQDALLRTLTERADNLSLALGECGTSLHTARVFVEESRADVQAAATSVNAADAEIHILNRKLHAWYRHPAVWTGVGMLLGVTTTVYISGRN